MTMHTDDDPTSSFDDVQRAVYEFVDRHGTATRSELLRSVRVDAGPAHSKPARSGNYTQQTALEPSTLESCLETLLTDGYLAESEGTLRVSVPGSPTELETGSGAVTIRTARESDREGILEAMRTVAQDGSYVVAADLATRLERAPALVRVNGTEDGSQSRICFAAVLDSSSESETATDAGSGVDPDSDSDSDSDSNSTPEAGSTSADEPDDTRIVGWLHLDVPALDSRSHTAELTVGVVPAHRRAGIGRTLLEHGLEWAKEAGYRKVVQGVPSSSETAISFLESNGWEREGVRTDHYRLDDEFVDEVLFATWPTDS
ncbi:GNAT family N-acetyltransferase [Natrialba asiatica]|uniref:N-acetyltransferase GCN5 n=1 Tax=Natrialba asiatica (strain ATCC 700177 / DSM 12278 / JCM 9576 / FERM P-10747 / NBRC 102637 / 172P1) TaxID=29540 RepID=M0AL28_NATA1|nr:GNAT family N-acetyltransferase [Natrialba asiatica]ELY99259.1 N-acetyltransferase GCN5 [Natrialba asiatica DSM 12278]